MITPFYSTMNEKLKLTKSQSVLCFMGRTVFVALNTSRLVKMAESTIPMAGISLEMFTSIQQPDS